MPCPTIEDYIFSPHAQFEMQRRDIKDSHITESDEEKPGIILDYDEAGHVVSLEILDASRRVSQPNQIVYELAGQPA